MILGSQAKLENDNKSVNVKRGLKARAEMGLWPSGAPTGYLNDMAPGKECHILIDPVRAPIMKQMFEKVGYEKWSGNWYQGQHTPIITKELFRLVQERITAETRIKTRCNDFIFTKLMICGYCESGITAQEKIKHLSDGSVHTYIYYSCTRHKDKDCKNPYIREEALVEQLLELIDIISIDTIGARHIIEREIGRYNKLRTDVLGIKEKTQKPDIDVRAYAKHMLKEGTIHEKRELLENLRSRIILKDRKIRLF